VRHFEESSHGTVERPLELGRDDRVLHGSRESVAWPGVRRVAARIGARDHDPEVAATLGAGDGYYESVFLDPDGNRLELPAGPAA
jgi:hypothetical protein